MQNYSTIPDDELTLLLSKGDRAAFTEIYNRYWENLLAIGYHHTNQKELAEDIVHDVMMSLWTRRTDIRIQSLKAYLATAVKFSVFKTLARKNSFPYFTDDIARQEVSNDICEKLDAKFVEEYLHGIVETLPSKAKIVFQYSRQQHLPVEIIADKLKLSPKAVEYHLTKALRVLREKLQKIKSYFF